MGRFFLRANGTAFDGRSLNTVSAFLTGGSWDAAGRMALYGYSRGAFRMARGTLVNGGVDLSLWKSTEIGVRRAWLTGAGAPREGTAITLAALWNGVGMSAALAAPEDDPFRGRWDRALVAGGLTVSLLR